MARGAPGLARTLQEDFAAGAIRTSARHLISSRGTYDVENGFHDDDGSIYRRGGVSVKSNPAADVCRFVWDGILGPDLQRTVVAGPTGLRVLGSNDTSMVTPGGGTLYQPTAPFKPAVIDGMMFLPSTDGVAVQSIIYGGSRRTTGSFLAGTVSVTNGSRIVTGAGTAWNGANPVQPGDLFYLTVGGLRVYVVESVQSNTQITLMQAVEDPTAAGLAYLIDTFLSAAPTHAKQATGMLFTTTFCAHENRLVWLDGKDTIRFTPGLDPETGAYRAHEHTQTDFHKVPAGVEVVALESLRDRLLVFTTAGLYAITNMAFDLVDGEGNVQQRMEKISDDLVAWGPTAICGYKGALVVAALDNIYVVDGVSEPVPVSQSFSPVLREAVQGSRPGLMVVYNGHIFLPVLGSSAPTETWVVRIDRPVQTSRGVVFAWSRMTGFAGVMWAFAIRARPGALPLLLGGHPLGLSSCGGVFVPSASNTADETGVADQEFECSITTRDFVTGDGAASMVRRVRLLYQLWGGELDAEVIDCYVTVDGEPGEVQLAGSAPETSVDSGMHWYAWPVDRRGKYVSFRFVLAAASIRFTMRAIDLWTRQSGRAGRGG